MREDDHFYCSHREFREWAANKKELRLEFFYRLMRKTHDILLDKDGNPEGGQWNFDQDNRKPYPKSGLILDRAFDYLDQSSTDLPRDCHLYPKECRVFCALIDRKTPDVILSY